MSSMVRKSFSSALLVSICVAGAAVSQTVSRPVVQPLPTNSSNYPNSGVTVWRQPASVSVPTSGEGSEWDQARARLRMSGSTSMAQAVDRWRMLSSYDNFSFSEYASFLVSYPGFPDQDKMRRKAERALDSSGASAQQLTSYFDRMPPLTNPARAQYALALAAQHRPEAQTVALAAWRGGPMSDTAESSLQGMLVGKLSPADQDARMDALLWAGATTQAQRQIAYVSPAARPGFMARLATVQGSDPASVGIPIPAELASDPGWLYNRSRQLRRSGQAYASVALLANRPHLSTLPLDQDKWVDELLTVAQTADAASAIKIAASIDDGFAPGTDVSRSSFALRDNYTTLMWLGGTKALWSMGNAQSAAPLFYRYGGAARTPQTRSKGFYWAGRALARSGDTAGATRYFEMAAAYSDQFYGLLALERLGRPVPRFATEPSGAPTAEERAAFTAKPITAAVREVARESDWQTSVRFFKEISEQANTEGEHILVADLARELGRRDLGVIDGQAAAADGHLEFQHIAFPLIPTPSGTSWTMVHAISRQESQFAQNAVSHAGARGLMQLMPGTAREQAGKIGLSYDTDALISNPGYNLQLGDAYFGRMMDYFGGSYPLAVAAYNAGPGNVNRWLSAYGDPRMGGVDWIDWIEKIPLSETRNYVQRVLENAVVYEAMNPDKASYTGPNPMSKFIGKRTPG
jgi:soluble lytic murein transglycosylase